MIVGAIFAFAIRTDPTWIDLRVVGLILMVAGGAVIWQARKVRRERVVTRVSDSSGPETGTEQVEEIVTEQSER